MAFDDLSPTLVPRTVGPDLSGGWNALFADALAPFSDREWRNAEALLGQLELEDGQGDTLEKNDPKKPRPAWLDGKTKPKTPVAPLAEYRRALRQFGAKDSEEFRQRFLQGFTEEDYAWLVPENLETESAPAPKPKPKPKRTKEEPPKEPVPTGPIGLVQVSVAAARSQELRNRQGLDSGGITVAIGDADRQRLLQLSKSEDPREELAVIALSGSGLGYSAAAIQAVTSKYGDGRILDNSRESVERGLGSSAPYEVYITSGIRRELYRKELELNGDTAALARYDFKLKVEDERARIEKQFAEIKPKDRLHESFLALCKENALKSAIDKIASEMNGDVRSGTTQQQQMSGVVDGIQSTFSALMDSNALYRYLPQSVKEQITEYGTGLLKGGVQIAGTIKGANDFVGDVAQDLLLAGAERSGLADKLGIDTEKMRRELTVSRSKDAELWRDITGAQSKRGAQQELAYQTKIDLGIRTTPYDIPNWSQQAGVLTAKAAPYLLVGIATGGTSVPAQIAINAAITGISSGGEIYNQSRSRPEAVKAAAWGAASGAVMPLSNKLGYAGDFAASSAFDYITTKIRDPNASDDQIIFGMLSQATMSGALNTGGKLNRFLSSKAGRTLNTQEAEEQYKSLLQRDLPTIKEEVALSARQQTQEVVQKVQAESTRIAKSRAPTPVMRPVAEVPTSRTKPLPKATSKANAEGLIARVEGYEEVHQDSFTTGMSQAIDEAVGSFSGLRRKGRITSSEIETVMNQVGVRRRQIKIETVEAEIRAAAAAGEPIPAAIQRQMRLEAQQYGAILPTVPRPGRSEMIDKVEADTRHGAYVDRTRQYIEQSPNGFSVDKKATILVGGKPTEVSLGTVMKNPLEDGYLIDHPAFGDSQVISKRGFEILAEVMNDRSMSEGAAMKKIAEAHYLLMHGTPYELGTPAIVEGTIDAILRERFGKTLPKKKPGMEPFWEAILSKPTDDGLREYVRRFRDFYE